MRTNRRGALALLGLGGAAAAATSAEATRVPVVSFHHGVASGDPLQDRVIVWTRINLRDSEDWDGQMEGWLEFGQDPGFKDIRTIPVTTNRARDWTVKVDVDGLNPGTEYFFRFKFSVYHSPTGRTRTLPDGPTRDVVLAVASCALYPMGYFNAYGVIAGLERVDAVLHLGDYIYEYGGAPGDYGMTSPVAKDRPPVPAHECLTLADYRARHARYKSDVRLQAAHARAPWIVVWDDHEVCNDSWATGGENHTPATEGDFAARKAAALKAYFEWMPIRDPAPGGLLESSWRSFRFGDLASVMMVETRLSARTEPLEYDARSLPFVEGKPDIAHFRKVLNDPARQMMGPRQEQWLAGELDRSVKAGETWQVIGNQVVMARVLAPNLRAKMGDQAFGAMLAGLTPQVADIVKKSSAIAALDVPLGLDTWDGYPAARERLYDLFKAARANPVVVSGDSHSFWANELWDEGRLNRVAAEFGTTGITSPGFADILGADVPIAAALSERNPEVKWSDSAAKGFVLLTLTRESARAEMLAVSTIFDERFDTAKLKTFTVAPVEGVGVGPVTEA